ncbi:hypothetical protein C8J38_10752 [Rhizobium sp. PP-WC-2G-219]|nr:hypothetical protein C8J38_10752 [Rhizobium sp. PP-WC-2G-219]
MIAPTVIRELTVSAEDGARPYLYLSAASGLVWLGSHYYVVADDELHIGQFTSAVSEPGRLIRVFDGVLPDDRKERKRRKPDLETLTLLPATTRFPYGALLALGSGSTPNRRRGAVLGLDPEGVVCGSPQVFDASPVLGPLTDLFPDLNIEGAVVVGDDLRLVQRGNARHAENAIVHYPLSRVLDAVLNGQGDTLRPSAIDRITLPETHDVPLCFTDAAALPNGDMVFCAVAENTGDAVADGPCVGAAIGIIGSDGRLVSLEPLDRPFKVEGIAVRVDGDRLDVRLVTDADDPAIPALLLSTSLAC